LVAAQLAGGFATQWGLRVEFVDADKLDAIAAAVKPGATKLVWLETPANPTWAITTSPLPRRSHTRRARCSPSIRQWQRRC